MFGKFQPGSLKRSFSYRWITGTNSIRASDIQDYVKFKSAGFILIDYIYVYVHSFKYNW